MIDSDYKSKPRNMDELFNNFKDKYADDNTSQKSDRTGSLYGGERDSLARAAERRHTARELPPARDFTIHSNESYLTVKGSGSWGTMPALPARTTRERQPSFSSQASSDIPAFKPRNAFMSESASGASTKAEDDEPTIQAAPRRSTLEGRRSTLGERRASVETVDPPVPLAYTNSMCEDNQADDEAMPESPFKRTNAHADGDSLQDWVKELQGCVPFSGALVRCLRQPGPRLALVQCVVKRTKNRLKGDIFQLFLEDTTTNEEYFVMAARRRVKAAVPTFLMSMVNGPDFLRDLKKSSQNIVGVLRGNRFGTQYRLFGSESIADADAAGNHGRVSSSSPLGDEIELAAVRFRQDGVSAVGGVRQFSAIVPDPGSCPLTVRKDGLLGVFDKVTKGDKHPDSGSISVLRSVVPQWEEKVKGYVLDFKGRVEKGSPKNCQLTTYHVKEGTNGQDVLFMFGKRNKDVYVMDFAYPMSIVQSFGIAIACFDTRSFAAA